MIFSRAPFRLAAPAHRSSFCAPESRPYILSAAMRTSPEAVLSQAQWISGAYMLTLSAPIAAPGLRPLTRTAQTGS